MQPAHRVLSYLCADGASYIDLAQDLSKINRRLYSQGMSYAVGSIDFMFAADPGAIISVAARVSTAGDTWTVHNAWKKAEAHWTAQQRRARRMIGQSAKPTWEDFKVYLDDAHRSAGNETLIDINGDAVGSGEWDYSKLLWEADDNSIDEMYLHLIGGDVGASGTPALGDWGLILGYQESRSTVQATDPELPADYSNNMYAKLATDEDLVADEVASNMEDENDQPPYDHDDYVGNDTNADWPMFQHLAVASVGQPHGIMPGFVAQCGLLRVDTASILANGAAGDAPNVLLNIHLVPGGYKGVLAEPMGQ